MPIRKLGAGQETPFFDFGPDLLLTTPGLVLDCSNAVPTVKGYKARNSAVQLSSSPLPAAPLGAFVAKYKDGTTSILAGTATNLYRYNSGAGTWTSIGSGYTATFPWVFSQFAEDVIASSTGNQIMQMASGVGGTFAALDPNAVQYACSTIAVAGFEMGFQGAGNGWATSSAGVDTGWSAFGTGTGAQLQTNGFLYDYPGSLVAGATLFKTAIIWKANSMYQLTFQQGNTNFPWSAQALSTGTGTWSQGCVCPIPNAIAFLGTDDFYITQGSAPNRIPNSMKEWFFAQVHRNAAGNPDQLNLTSSWYDPATAIVYWHYISNNPPYAGIPDRYVAWNSRSGRWAPGYLNTPLVVWNTQVGQQNGLYFDLNYQLWTWTGAPATMYVLTGYQGDADNLTQLQRVRVAYNQTYLPTSQTCIPMHVNRMGDYPIVEGAAVFNSADGWHNLRVTDRYHQIQIQTNGAAELMAMAYEGRIAGVR